MELDIKLVVLEENRRKSLSQSYVEIVQIYCQNPIHKTEIDNSDYTKILKLCSETLLRKLKGRPQTARKY